jgi:hypothetical protein
MDRLARSARLLLLSIAVALSCLVSNAPGAVLRVPSEYSTINAALDAAASGDTVLVAPGIYTDYEVRMIGSDEVASCVFMIGGVLLRSEEGPESTTIKLEGAVAQWTNVVAWLSQTQEATIEGFTFRENQPYRGCVYAVLCPKLTLRDCIFVEMDAAGSGGGAIRAVGNDLEVVGSRFLDCTAGFAGAISLGDARLLVKDCYFEGCGDRAVGVMGEQGVNPEGVEIRDSRFVGNYSDGDGAGVWASQINGEVLISGCVFEGNSGQLGGGGAAIAALASTVEGCVFAHNSASSPGSMGGALIAGNSTVLTCNTFFENEQVATAWGGAAVVFAGGSSQLWNNVIAGSKGGPAVLVYSCSLTSSCNVFWENEGGIGDGYTPGPTDQEVNPLFCDPENGDLSLAENSPCLPPQSGACGLIGALGEGCGAISVESRSWGRIKNLYR